MLNYLERRLLLGGGRCKANAHALLTPLGSWSEPFPCYIADVGRSIGKVATTVELINRLADKGFARFSENIHFAPSRTVKRPILYLSRDEELLAEAGRFERDEEEAGVQAEEKISPATC